MLLTITQDHIDEAEAIRRNSDSYNICSSCPTALALKELIHTSKVSVNNVTALVGVVQLHHSKELKENVISAFNANYPAIPGTYELTPTAFDYSFWF